MGNSKRAPKLPKSAEKQSQVPKVAKQDRDLFMNTNHEVDNNPKDRSKNPRHNKHHWYVYYCLQLAGSPYNSAPPLTNKLKLKPDVQRAGRLHMHQKGAYGNVPDPRCRAQPKQSLYTVRQSG